MRFPWARAAGVALVTGAMASLPIGCDTPPKREPEAVVRSGPAPAYAGVAAEYNKRVARLDRLWARAVVRLNSVDEGGKEREDQGEGIMQLIRPDRMALSIKKAGSMLFWFGCDQERYWLFDLVEEPIVRVGRHDRIADHREAGAQAGLGLEIKPLDLIRLLGIMELPTGGAGAGSSAWSKDGRLVEVTTALGEGTGADGGRQVISMDPDVFLPRRIAIVDRGGNVLISADLEQYEPVDIAGFGGIRPRIAARIDVNHPQSRTRLRVDLSDMRNAGVVEGAFEFEALRRSMSVERIIDLDAPRAASPQ